MNNIVISINNNMQNSQEQFKDPLLFFLLQHNKFAQIIKAAINKKVSDNLLKEFGEKQYQFDNYEQHKIAKDIKNFTVLQIIQLRGNSQKRPKQCYNRMLIETLKRKIKTQEIDAQTRRKMWLQLTQIYNKPGFYQNIKQLQLATDFQIIIQKDIARTNTSTTIRGLMRQVLYTFAKYNPYIGYCQGMNFIAAFLLEENFTSEESFYIIKYLTQDILVPDYYTKMNSVMSCMRIFYEILHFTHPKIYAKLKEIVKLSQSTFISVLIFVFQEFVCLFSKGNFKKQLIRKIWDLLLLEGSVTLFKAGIALFDSLQSIILSCTNYQQYMSLVEPEFYKIEDNQIIYKRMLSMYISPLLLNILKDKITTQLEQQDKKQIQGKKYKTNIKKCDRRWNVCAQKLQNNFQQKKNFQIFVFRKQNPINIIQNYLQKLDKRYFDAHKYSHDITQQIMVGRISHICRPRSDTLTESSISEKQSRTAKTLTPQKSQETDWQKRPQGLYYTEELIRKKVATKLHQTLEKRSGMVRTESVIFMEKMVQNASISNLLQIYDIDQMFE